LAPGWRITSTLAISDLDDHISNRRVVADQRNYSTVKTVGVLVDPKRISGIRERHQLAEMTLTGSPLGGMTKRLANQKLFVPL